MSIKPFGTKPESYVYSHNFTTDRKLTHEEIINISCRAGKAIREIIQQETGQDPDAYNNSSGIENR